MICERAGHARVVVASTQQRYRNTPTGSLPSGQVKAPLRPYLAGNKRAVRMRVRPLGGQTDRRHAIPDARRRPTLRDRQ